MPLSADDCAATYKVLILGDDSVGKSALLDSLVGRPFRETMYPTIGVDFVRKIFEVDGALVQLAIWDTAGQERFRSITKLQYKGVQGLILVYDVTNELTFQTLKYWIHSIQDEIARTDGSYEPIPMILCGNKSDLIREKKVSTAKGQKMADREMAFGFYETSAKTGDNVFAAFRDLAFHITDICNPKLMKSYHPHLIRPIREHDPSLSLDANLRQFKAKSRFQPMNWKTSQNSENRINNMAAASAASTKGDNSRKSSDENILSYPPWETCSLNGDTFSKNSSEPTTTKNKRKSIIKSKDKKRTKKDRNIKNSSSPSVFQRTFGCLLCRNVCVGRKSKTKRERERERVM